MEIFAFLTPSFEQKNKELDTKTQKHRGKRIYLPPIIRIIFGSSVNCLYLYAV